MTEEIRGAVLPEETVIRLLEQQSRYGLDQETMLIYISSINLMSILTLMSRRYGGGSGLSVPAPGLPVLPPLAPGTAPGSGLSLENMVGLLMKMLGNQGGGNASGGQGLNPAMLLSLFNALGGQNMDLGGLMNLLAGLMGASKPAAGPGQAAPPKPSAPGGSEGGIGAKPAVEENAVKRDVPKIMKWDQLDDRRKA